MLSHVSSFLLVGSSSIFGSTTVAAISPFPSPTANLSRSGGSISFTQFTQPSRTFVNLHGWFMWVSMGLCLPLGIIIVRMAKGAIRNRASSRRIQAVVYSHMLIQTLGVVSSLVGGVIGFSKFGNDFPTTHERLGLALLILTWSMPITGLLRPQRGVSARPFWYGLHWLVGTGTVILGCINIYIGMHAYELIFSSSLRAFNILFSIQLSVMGLIYLSQDRWRYLKEQGSVRKSVVPPVQVSAA